jgi:hypothetical protein
MKKLKSNKNAFAGGEVLNRTQLKNILGGTEKDPIGEVGGGAGCTEPGGMCNAHSECCQPISGTVICLGGSDGYYHCTRWN